MKMRTVSINVPLTTRVMLCGVVLVSVEVPTEEEVCISDGD